MEISNVHHQAMASHHQLEEVLGCPKVQRQQPQQQQQLERKPRPHPEQALKCPRCDSTNTKFCYYNNYSLSQPRYFCKGCRRYWTQGGSLRNVPVGGGCRKNKRSSSSSSSCSKRQQDHQDHNPTTSNLLLPDLIPPPPPFSYDPNDLSLAFASIHKQQPTRQLGIEESNNFLLANPNSTTSPLPTAPAGSFLDILRSGFLDTNNQSGFQSLYSGFGGNGDVQVETGVGGEEAPQLRFEGGLSGATTPTTTDSQGSCKVVDGGESKVLPIAHQWQVAGDGNLVMDSGRDYWNGLGSSWHGLINSSLMQ